jgi:hypothetical protein
MELVDAGLLRLAGFVRLLQSLTLIMLLGPETAFEVVEQCGAYYSLVGDCASAFHSTTNPMKTVAGPWPSPVRLHRRPLAP